MSVIRMDNVAIVVDDLDAAIAFFADLGLTLEGRAEIEGEFADQTTGLDGVRSEIAMMRTPDGHGLIELTKYYWPKLEHAPPSAPNTLGLHRVMFAVDDIDDTIERLGAQVLGSVANYQDTYRLCYVRGPGGIIVALAEQVVPTSS